MQAIREELPGVDMVYVGDLKNNPYGDKSDAELFPIAEGVVRQLVMEGARLVVIACNTATTRCIAHLRQVFPDLIFVGTEPAVKLACDAGCRKILILATAATTNSARLKWLIENFCREGQSVERLACPGLAEAVESEDDERIRRVIGLLTESVDRASYDGVVLGCTHYVRIERQIQEFFPDAKLFNGNRGVARRVATLMAENGLSADEGGASKILFNE